jgi:hypothetical protein
MSSELKQFLAPYTPVVQVLALKLRALIRAVMPETIEQLDPPTHLIGYGLDRTYKGLICGITLHKAHINLRFARGTEQIAPNAERPVVSHIGIDVGLKSLAVLSTGETIANPRWYRTQTRKLRRTQKALSRKLKGSRNREKARAIVARLHQKIGN